MHIDKLKNDQGVIIDADGRGWDDAESYFVEGILGFCGCGMPEEALDYVYQALKHIDERKGLTWPEVEQKQAELFPITGSNYFMFYLLDNLALIEHGGSVPGWLTDAGRELMEDIEELYYEEDDAPEKDAD